MSNFTSPNLHFLIGDASEATVFPLKEVGKLPCIECVKHRAWFTGGATWAGAPTAIIPQASAAQWGRGRVTCHPQPPSCHKGRTAPSCRQALRFSENSVPHHSRLVTNSFLSSCITYTTERKERLFLSRTVSPAPLTRAAERRNGEETGFWEAKGGKVTGNEDVEGPGSWERGSSRWATGRQGTRASPGVLSCEGRNAPARELDSSTAACQAAPTWGRPAPDGVTGAQQVPSLWVSPALWTPLESEQMASLRAATTGFNKVQARAWKNLERRLVSGRLLAVSPETPFALGGPSLCCHHEARSLC